MILVNIILNYISPSLLNTLTYYFIPICLFLYITNLIFLLLKIGFLISNQYKKRILVNQRNVQKPQNTTNKK